MRKICVVTGTRAEYGLLRGLMMKIQACNDAELQIIATNMHLMSEFGYTYKEIENDGFVIDEKVYMPKFDGKNVFLADSMSVELKEMNSALLRLSPDIIVILGDRYEMMIVALVALINNIPLAHIHGGEVTEGAFDDAIRHSITKMSYLHFTSTEVYRKRVIQLGESPNRVFNVGALGVENIHKISQISKIKLEEYLDLILDNPTILVTYHPVTLKGNEKQSIADFLRALGEYNEYQIIFTMPNSDPGNDVIRDAILDFSNVHKENVRCFNSLGVNRYLSIIPYMKAVVGNSSSGIIEVPSFGIPTLNIGDRQNGRIMADSVVCCSDDFGSIKKGLDMVLSDQFYSKSRNVLNPYDKSNTADSIFQVIMNCELFTIKKFNDILF